MRILLVSQYFPPETGGPQNRVSSFAEELSGRGHDVSVITAKPNYPAGEIFDGYEQGWFVDSEYEGVPVTHCCILPDGDKTPFRRLLFYVSFMVTAVLAALRNSGGYDIVLASSPPLFVGISGWIIGRIKSARFVFDVRDLWPDVAVAMGELAEGPISWAAARLERYIYRKADGVAAVTEGFCRTIRDRTPPETPVVRVSNGTDPDVFQVSTTSEQLREELRLPGGFLVTYAGNIGLCQGLHHVLQAAGELAEDHPDIHFLFLGEGPAKADLMEAAEKRRLTKVHFRDRVPLERAVRVMAASDALLVPLADHDIYRSFIPSKLFDSMAVGRPVVLSVEGEAREILDDAQAGVFYPPEDGQALAQTLVDLKSCGDVDEMGVRGRSYVMEKFTRTQQAKRLIELLEDVMKHRRDEGGTAESRRKGEGGGGQ